MHVEKPAAIITFFRTFLSNKIITGKKTVRGCGKFLDSSLRPRPDFEFFMKRTKL